MDNGFDFHARNRVHAAARTRARQLRAEAIDRFWTRAVALVCQSLAGAGQGPLRRRNWRGSIG